MTNGSSVIIRPVRNISGSVRLPGDKSISHRYAMLAAIADGKSVLRNYSTGRDCASTLECMRELGCQWTRNDQNVIEIQGRGPVLCPPRRPLDCGNSGSTMRMLSGIVAGQQFTSEMVGDESLSHRPMARVIRPLAAMGASIAASDGGRPPLRITGQRLKAIEHRLPIASAQVKTCLLFAGLFAEGETRVDEPLRTRDHGELALRAFGAEVSTDKNSAAIRGGQKLHAIEADIPADISSAAFFLCAAALFRRSEIVLPGLLMNPTRARLLDVLIQLGLCIQVTQLEEHHGELVGTIHAEGDTLQGISIARGDTAALIDELPVLAAIAPYSERGIEITDARELRVKESDRIAVVVENLRVMGATVEEREDGMRIPGRQILRGADLDSHGDHRIAMAFSTAALRAEGETRILNAEAASISYPGFFEALESVVVR
jgi:3-phosphoshikimate 1-carboxyvinyltransferase